jgi:transposase-like protein
MAQHFLLTAKARTLSLKRIARMSDEEAHATFCEIRWSANNSQPWCPHCGCTKIYAFTDGRRWKCAECRKKFTATSHTLFHSRKLPIQDYLAAIAIFINAVKGISALQLGRDLDVSYKTAYVLSHKLREAQGTLIHDTDELYGVVEIDGAYFGAAPRPENKLAERADRRTARDRNPNRRVVAVARERRGRTLPYVVRRESDAVWIFRRKIAPGTIVHADESRAWDVLHASFDMRRVNHSVELVGENGESVNQAESYNARIRRLEYGQHHRINGDYLQQYANETAWREDFREEDNGYHWRLLIRTSLNLPKSSVWCGYWQRGQGNLFAIPGSQL